jgi:hypothetical protein
MVTENTSKRVPRGILFEKKQKHPQSRTKRNLLSKNGTLLGVAYSVTIRTGLTTVFIVYHPTFAVKMTERGQ